LTWGVPVLLLDLIGVPRQYWVVVALISLPGTLCGVVIYSLLEHKIFSRSPSKHDEPPRSHD